MKENGNKELDFSLAQNQLEKQIEAHLERSGQTLKELPHFVFEKGKSLLSYGVDTLNEVFFYNALDLLNKHIENLQFQSFEPGYISLQDAGSPITTPQDPKHLKQGIRFRFISLTQTKKVEVEKLGNFTQDELQCCIKLFALFYPTEKKSDPSQNLERLGAKVYLPKKDQKTQVGLGEENQEKSAFKSFVGYPRIQEEIFETIISPLKHPEIFREVAQATRGQSAQNLARAVLFQGPAGVGKTTVARLIGQETGIPLIYVPVENILSKYYGESAQNLARVFDSAALYPQAIIFVDEIDALATSREKGLYEATRRLLSVLLRKIDGFESKAGLLTLGATNRTKDLDRALLSRFDTVIHFPLPNASERAMIFRHYARHLERKDLENLAHASKGIAGRDIEDICKYTERRWAHQLITQKKGACPPPTALYLEVCKIIQAQQEHYSSEASDLN